MTSACPHTTDKTVIGNDRLGTVIAVTIASRPSCLIVVAQLNTDKCRMSDISLETLIARTAAGDQQALRAIYQQTSGKLLGIITGILMDRAQAEEALQETFLTAWRNASRFDPDRGHPMAWLITIARSRAIDSVRKTKRSPQIDDAADTSTFQSDAPTPEDIAIQTGDAAQLARCLDELRTEQRNCITLAYWRGYTHSELAELLNHPLGTIKSWTRRGLSSLKDCLTR